MVKCILVFLVKPSSPAYDRVFYKCRSSSSGKEEEDCVCVSVCGEMGNFASLKEFLPKSFFSWTPYIAVCELALWLLSLLTLHLTPYRSDVTGNLYDWTDL